MGAFQNMSDFNVSKDKKNILNRWEPGTAFKVEAPAGTGKTTLGILFLEVLKEHFNEWERALYLTYSKLAKIQIKSTYQSLRKKSVISSEAKKHGDIFNFHSFWWQLIEKYWGFLGVSKKPLLATLKKQQQFLSEGIDLAIEKNIVPEYFLKKAGGVNSHKDKKLKRLCSNALMAEKFGIEYLGESYSEVSNYQQLLNFFKEKIITRNKSGLFWHDDTIHWAHKLVDNHPNYLSWFKATYKVLLIDEFQDIDLAQWELIKKLQPESIIIFADSKQTIHLWRGADPERLEEFQIYGEDNYRKNYNEQLTNVHRTDNKDFADNSMCELIAVTPAEERSILIKFKEKTRKILHNNKAENVAILCLNNDVADGIFKYFRKKTGGYPPKRICRFGVRNSPVMFVRSFASTVIENGIDEKLLIENIRKIIPYEPEFRLEFDYNPRKEEYKKMNEAFKNLFYNFDESLLDGINYMQNFLDIFIRNQNKLTEKSINWQLLMTFKKLGKDLSALERDFDSLMKKEQIRKINKILNQHESYQLSQEFKGVGVMTVHQAKGREFDYVILPWLHNSKWPVCYNFTRQKWVDAPDIKNVFHVAKTRAKEGVVIFYPEEAPSPLVRDVV